MVISKTPFRMSFAGGGSDMPSFFRRSHGAVVSSTIDKFMFISVHANFDRTTRVCYRQIEETDGVADIKHPLVRETLLEMGINGGIEITSTADIPGQGSGLGSSSSYTVGLINALAVYGERKIMSPTELAELACKIEIERCQEPIGKQDQYAAALGGFRLYQFFEDGSVESRILQIAPTFFDTLRGSILFFHTGISRSASSVLADQKRNIETNKSVDSLERMRDLAYSFADAVEANDMRGISEVLNENWALKKRLASNISSTQLDSWYSKAMAAGASGGKLLGAGSGGFFMFLAPPESHAEIKMALSDLRCVPVDLTIEGSKILVSD